MVLRIKRQEVDVDARRLQNRKRKKQVQHTNRKEGLCDCDLLYESLSPVKIAKKKIKITENGITLLEKKLPAPNKITT